MHTALDDSGGCLSENADKFMHLGLRGKGKVLNSACLYMSLIKQKIKLIYRAPNEISRGLSGCQWSASLSHCKLKDQEVCFEKSSVTTVDHKVVLWRELFIWAQL